MCTITEKTEVLFLLVSSAGRVVRTYEAQDERLARKRASEFGHRLLRSTTTVEEMPL
jgi:hypothetical protein